MMIFPRSSGILLHPTSLPGRYGVGDLGDWAYYFVDYLAAASQSVWQILPLGPTSYGDSPYQTLSAFAGNTLLISLDKLVEEGWLSSDDLADAPEFPHDRVDYGPVIDYHNQMLALAYERFSANPGKAKRHYEAWSKHHSHWLDDFALFMALKVIHEGRPWVEWEPGLALRDEAILEAAKQDYADMIEQFRVRQWWFFKQWSELKTYANNSGIRLIGDAPIFVAHDSSDVWANQELFYLDEQGNPTVIAGVPPDYFSPTGQRWGNPLYRWEVMAKDNYAWWLDRLAATFELVDILRIDHFRGFEAYWEVPASEPTAMIGQWVKGPGLAFFEVVEKTFGALPIIAEDLGVITPEVVAIRDATGLPGMKVLQFAWGGRGGENSFLPYNHVPNSVVYSGTHDNNTTLGWWQDETDGAIRSHLARFIDRPVQEPNWEMIRLAIPMQDVLSLGEEARMNVPGRPGGNWTWRVLPEQLEDTAIDRLAKLTVLYGRAPQERKKRAAAQA
jgi:4-alpha-glucanotransferase